MNLRVRPMEVVNVGRGIFVSLFALKCSPVRGTIVCHVGNRIFRLVECLPKAGSQHMIQYGVVLHFRRKDDAAGDQVRERSQLWSRSILRGHGGKQRHKRNEDDLVHDAHVVLVVTGRIGSVPKIFCPVGTLQQRTIVCLSSSKHKHKNTNTQPAAQAFLCFPIALATHHTNYWWHLTRSPPPSACLSLSLCVCVCRVCCLLCVGSKQ